MDPVTTFALIGVLGIGSQWLAWRFQLPAIVLMLLAGVLAGPVTGLIDPEASFGFLLKPIIAVAVAVILFEGGLTLNFKSLRDAGPSVLRLVMIGAPVGWLLSAISVHYIAGLSWETAIVFPSVPWRPFWPMKWWWRCEPPPPWGGRSGTWFWASSSPVCWAIWGDV